MWEYTRNVYDVTLAIVVKSKFLTAETLYYRLPFVVVTYPCRRMCGISNHVDRILKGGRALLEQHTLGGRGCQQQTLRQHTLLRKTWHILGRSLLASTCLMFGTYRKVPPTRTILKEKTRHGCTSHDKNVDPSLSSKWSSLCSLLCLHGRARNETNR